MRRLRAVIGATRVGLVCALLLCGLAGREAWAGPEDALPALTRARYQDAASREQRGDLDGAAVAYRSVLRTEPGFAAAAVGLGRVRDAAGDAVGAAEAYRLAPFDADAVEALGRLALREGWTEEALAALRRLRTLRPGVAEVVRLQAQAVAARDPDEARRLIWTYLSFPTIDDGPEARFAVAEIGDRLVMAGKSAAAAELFEVALARWPDAPELLPRADRLRVEAAARALAGAAPEPVIGPHATELRVARDLFASGDLEGSASRLGALSVALPRSPEVWAALADVREAQGEVEAAEISLARARALDPMDARYAARFGELLATHYAGRFDAEALDAYREALRLKPTWIALWPEVARLELRVGEREAAAATLAEVVARGGAADAERATAMLADLVRERPSPPRIPPAPGRPASVPQAAWESVHIAAVYQRQGRVDEARTELAQALEVAPTYTRALNQAALLELEAGDRAAATAWYERSLDAELDQPEVWLALAEMADVDGDREVAAARFAHAASLGAGDAHYHLARLSLAPWEAWGHLDAYFASATSGAYHEDAAALRRELERDGQVALVAGVAGLSLLVALPGLLWVRRRRGGALQDLLDRAPRTHREVATIGAAIRHEVLKHSTTVLPSVADALDDRDPEPAAWAAERLFGERGAVARFAEHVDALEALGASHGVELALRRRDPVIAPLASAIDRLARLEGAMRGGGAGPALAHELRELSSALHGEHYRALSALLRRLCVLEVDAELVRGVWARLDDGGARPAWELVWRPDAALQVRMFRGELEDALANLLRNATAASEGVEGAAIAVVVELEDDDITGLEQVAIRVADRAPGRLTTAMLRSRYIERGLGLVVEIVRRNGGTVHVEAQSGYAKAVVVRLPRIEGGVDDEEGLT